MTQFETKNTTTARRLAAQAEDRRLEAAFQRAFDMRRENPGALARLIYERPDYLIRRANQIIK